MTLQNTPNERIVNFVITMYYTISEINNSPSMSDFYGFLSVNKAIHGFSNNLQLTFDGTANHQVIFIFGKRRNGAGEFADMLDCFVNIKQQFFGVFFHLKQRRLIRGFSSPGL